MKTKLTNALETALKDYLDNRWVLQSSRRDALTIQRQQETSLSYGKALGLAEALCTLDGVTPVTIEGTDHIYALLWKITNVQGWIPEHLDYQLTAWKEANEKHHAKTNPKINE